MLIGKGVRRQFAEQFRLLALTVDELAGADGLKTILVMSAYPKEGRSITAANLGIALAEIGRRVALVDADVDRRGLSRLFEVDEQPGTAAARDVPPALGTDVAGLTIVPASALGDQALVEKVLGSLRPNVDYVLIDSAPCLGSAAGFLLVPHVEGILYVVRRRAQDVAAQRAVQSQIKRLGGRVLGVVYNEA
jgi:Mrp family chromosome partitioning ATPase